MKKYLKKYKYLIFGVILIFILIGLSFFQLHREHFGYASVYYEIKEKCYDGEDPSHTYCRSFENREHLERYIKALDPVKRYKKLDAITVTCEIVELTFFNLLQYFSPLLISFMVLGVVQDTFSSGDFENYLLRMDYKKYLRKNYKIALVVSLIMPISLVVIFIIASLYTGFNFNISNVNVELAVYNGWKYNHFLLYGFLICLVQFLISLFYSNVALYCCHANKNKLVAIIMSYVIFIVADLFVYIIIYALIINKILGFNQLTDYFNIAGYWFFNHNRTIFELLIVVLVSFILQAISFIIIYNIYRKKERVVLSYEKMVG